MSSARRSNRLLVLIGITKLMKAALLVGLGIGAGRLMHHDVAEVFRHWAHAVRVDPQNRYLHAVLFRLTGIDDRRLREIEVGTFLYAALFATEGIGLVLRKRWAEYVTVVTTSLLLPVEVYEMVHRFRVAKLVVFLLNVAIVVYLVYRLVRDHRDKRAARET